MILLQTLVNQLKTKETVFFPAVGLNQAQSASVALVKAGRVRIPRGYLNFLTLTDGFACGDLEFFSCSSHERAGTVFDHPSLMGYHKQYATARFFAKRLVLGRCSEGLICYNAQNNTYELLDRNALLPIVALPRFEDMLYHLLNETP